VSRQKIVFLAVLVVVGLFIASIVASMFPAKRSLRNGYQMLVADKGETWLRSPDRHTLLTDVTSVWSSADRMVVESRTLNGVSHQYGPCDYQVVVGRGSPHAASKDEALAMIPGMKREAVSPHTCVR
jgi:hypothetical protein